MKITWDQASEIMERAVKRVLPKRESQPIKDLMIDETSFQKRHEYVTVVTDWKSGTIIKVLHDRKKATLKEWLEQNRGQLQAVRSVLMDMWELFINAVRKTIEGGRGKDLLRPIPRCCLIWKGTGQDTSDGAPRAGGEKGISSLTRTSRDWLRTKAKNEYKEKRLFLNLTKLNLKTARAWRIKQAANGLRSYSY